VTYIFWFLAQSRVLTHILPSDIFERIYSGPIFPPTNSSPLQNYSLPTQHLPLRRHPHIQDSLIASRLWLHFSTHILGFCLLGPFSSALFCLLGLFSSGLVSSRFTRHIFFHLASHLYACLLDLSTSLTFVACQRHSSVPPLLIGILLPHAYNPAPFSLFRACITDNSDVDSATANGPRSQNSLLSLHSSSFVSPFLSCHPILPESPPDSRPIFTIVCPKSYLLVLRIGNLS